jgi:hypothetical protein
VKIKAHIRVAKDRNGRNKIAATVKPNPHPLTKADGTVLPTISFAVEFDVPDGMFRQAEQVIATLTIPESQAEIAAEVRELV